MKEYKNIKEIRYNNFGSKMIIENYNSYDDITVKFIDYGNLVHSRYDNFIRGKVKNPYDRSVKGVGYLGEGKYKVTENGKMTKTYQKWVAMIRRCYDEEFQGNLKSYKGCTVCDEWHNYQNFAAWYDENYYEIKNEKMSLDKDILIKGNKLYSPDTCIIVPQCINTLFVKSNTIRGNFPIGVSWNKEKKKYESNYFNRNKRIKLGYFNTIEEAFAIYKENKEGLIIHIANEYKEQIPHKLYNAMINYKVDITD